MLRSASPAAPGHAIGIREYIGASEQDRRCTGLLTALARGSLSCCAGRGKLAGKADQGAALCRPSVISAELLCEMGVGRSRFATLLCLRPLAHQLPRPEFAVHGHTAKFMLCISGLRIGDRLPTSTPACPHGTTFSSLFQAVARHNVCPQTANSGQILPK